MCRRTKAAADVDREVTYRRLRAARCLRRSTDAEGAYHLHLATTADDGARIDAALAPVFERHLAEARSAGRREPMEAYAADALVELVTGDQEGPRASRAAESKVIALVDVEALRRGSTEGEERCELAGVGPVPVSTVQSMLTDAFLALVVTNGVDVFTVAHVGRQVSAHQRSALEARGYHCEVPGCASRHGLELDHLEEWSLTKRTALEHLAWECRYHHGLRTYHGYRLEGPVGARRWLAPRPPSTGPPPRAGPAGPDATLFEDAGAA
ncbi:hypothetical protein BH18ACT1_BH18ACT1_16830 [soil metagenome]